MSGSGQSVDTLTIIIGPMYIYTCMDVKLHIYTFFYVYRWRNSKVFLNDRGKGVEVTVPKALCQCCS